MRPSHSILAGGVWTAEPVRGVASDTPAHSLSLLGPNGYFARTRASPGQGRSPALLVAPSGASKKGNPHPCGKILSLGKIGSGIEDDHKRKEKTKFQKIENAPQYESLEEFTADSDKRRGLSTAGPQARQVLKALGINDAKPPTHAGPAEVI
jgi:hypothetical protein